VLPAFWLTIFADFSIARVVLSSEFFPFLIIAAASQLPF
jgi:hypothetical protein